MYTAIGHTGFIDNARLDRDGRSLWNADMCAAFVESSIAFRLQYIAWSLEVYVNCGNRLFATENFKPVFCVFVTWNCLWRTVLPPWNYARALNVNLYDTNAAGKGDCFVIAQAILSRPISRSTRQYNKSCTVKTTFHCTIHVGDLDSDRTWPQTCSELEYGLSRTI